MRQGFERVTLQIEHQIRYFVWQTSRSRSGQATATATRTWATAAAAVKPVLAQHQTRLALWHEELVIRFDVELNSK